MIQNKEEFVNLITTLLVTVLACCPRRRRVSAVSYMTNGVR